MNEEEARKITKAHRLINKPIRTCRWMNQCDICEGTIIEGQQYYDGGSRLRGHIGCVTEWGKKEIAL